MSFLQPWAVWFLAGLPVIVLLYFLRLKRRAITVSTHLFWQRVLQESSRRAFFQRLRHLLSLLLNLLIFALIAAALARPLLQGDRTVRHGDSTILIVDTRARMQATTPGEQSRFLQAQAAARKFARDAGPKREFALLTVAASPRVAVPFTDDEEALRQGLDALTPNDGTGDLSAALRLANSLLASRGGDRRIVIFSDREDPSAILAPAAPPAAGALPAPAIAWQTFGTPSANLAITRFATRPLPASPETSEALLEIQNFSAQAAQSELEISFDGRPLEVRQLTFLPGERKLEVFTSVPRPGRNARGWLTARLAAPDALPLDNVAYATLPPSRPKRVLLLSKGNPFLEKLLLVHPSLKYEILDPEAWQASLAPKFAAVIFDRALPANFDYAATPGNFFFLQNTPFNTGGAALEQPLISDLESSNPTLRGISLQNTTILRAQPLALPSPREGWRFAAPLRSFDHPLLITGESNQQRVAALGFDLLESDLPLHVAFPLLISNTLQWLAGDESDKALQVRAGETFPLTAGQKIAAEPLLAPPPIGKPPATPLTGFLQPQRNGFYRLTEGDAEHWLAVNTFSAAESDLRNYDPHAAPAPAPISSTLQAFSEWPLWHWLALGALALFTAEWFLFHRRKTE
jgi:hypothetical protein